MSEFWDDFLSQGLWGVHFLVLTATYLGFVVLLFQPRYRWRMLTYRRAGTALVICLAAEALENLLYAVQIIKLWPTFSEAGQFDLIDYVLGTVRAPMNTIVQAFGPTSIAALLLLFLKDRGHDLVGGWGAGRRGLDPYDNNT